MPQSSKYDISKISISILEHLVEPVIGSKTLQELRKPVEDEALRVNMARALKLAEESFIDEFPNREISGGVLNLSLSDHPSIAQAVRAFYDRPNKDPVLAKIIVKQLRADYPRYPEEELDLAAHHFIKNIIEELVNVDGKFQSKIQTHQAIRTTNLLESIKQRSDKVNEKHSRIRSLPPLPNSEKFIGRDGDLNKLKKKLGLENLEDKRRYIIIRGWPGVGKTTLATFLAYEEDVENYFTDGVFWASLGDNPNLYSEIYNWAQTLSIEDKLRKCSLEAAAKKLTEEFKDKKALIIIDDVYELIHGQLFKGIGGSKCTTVFTTRHNNIANQLADIPSSEIYELERLSDSDSIKLLKLIAPSTYISFPDEVSSLAFDLEGLPLALQVAGKLLYKESKQVWGISPEFFSELRESSLLISQQPPGDRLLEIADETNPTIAALLKKTTDLLDPSTKDYFALLGAFAPKPATFDLEDMADLWSVDDPKPILGNLYDYGLIETVGDKYWMHSILAKFAIWLLENE